MGMWEILEEKRHQMPNIESSRFGMRENSDIMNYRDAKDMVEEAYKCGLKEGMKLAYEDIAKRGSSVYDILNERRGGR